MTLTAARSARSTRQRRRLSAFGWGALGVLAVAVIWEVYKFLGPSEGFVVGATSQTGSGLMLLPRTHDRAMPHIWQMFGRLLEPTSGGTTPPLIVSVLSAGALTLGIAAVGWIIGVTVGALLGLVMQRWRLVEWGILPWIVVSQTVPLIAFAPIVNALGNQLARQGGVPWPQWLSVAVIASYLAFFPVAIGALRGLAAPDRIHLDLMRSYAAGYWPTLLRLRLPSAVPYLLPALRLAAANAVVGAVVAEVSIGMRGGIGRMLIQLAGQGSSDPSAPWGPTFGAVALGLIAAGSVAIVGVGLARYRRGEATA